jgi:hypothetical protein
MRCILFPCLLGLACIPHQPTLEESSQDWVYTGEIVAQFEVSSPSDPVMAEALSPIARVTEEIELQIRVQPSRSFRDGSQGWWVELERMVIAERLGENWSTPLAHPLQGRGVELRRFGDGEILHIDQADYLFGGELGGESYDLIFSLISPHPPDLRVGESQARRTRWPFAAARALGWENRQSLEWTNLGQEEWAGVSAWKLDYHGVWSVEGGARDPYPDLAVTGSGPVQGTVWLRESDHRVLEHSFQWSRQLRLEIEADPAIELVQTQDFSGHLRMQP